MRLVLLAMVAVCAAGQPAPRNRLTFSGGWSRDIGGVSFRQLSATGLGVSYGRRVWRYMDIEGGVFTALDPTGEVCTAHGCQDSHDNFLWAPFGVRLIAPSFGGRMEISAGGGGLWERYRSDNPFVGGPIDRRGWGGYFVAGAAVAFDRGRHFWLGVAPRWFLANPAYARDRWFQVTGEVSFRFK